MTKKLQELLNLPPNDDKLVEPTPVDAMPVPTIDLQDKLEEFDKTFELKKYFPKQQLRKSFIQTQLMFNHEKEKIKLKVI